MKISFSELYGDIKEIQNTNELGYALKVLFGLFEWRITDYEDDNMEDFRTLYKTFYGLENPNQSNNLIDLSRSVEKESEAYHYQKLFEFLHQNNGATLFNNFWVFSTMFFILGAIPYFFIGLTNKKRGQNE